MLENMLDRVYSQQMRKTEATIRKRLDKIGECPPVANEISELAYNNNIAKATARMMRWILIDFLTLDIEHKNVSLSLNDLAKENPKALMYQLENALKLNHAKSLLKESKNLKRSKLNIN